MNFDSVIEEHYKKFYKLFVNSASKRLSGNYAVAEEAVQEAYLKAYQYKSSFDMDKGFDKWFRTIFNNVVKDIARLEKSQGAVETPVEDMEDPIIYSEDLVLGKLNSYTRNKRDRQILNLRYIVGMPLKDIPFFVSTSYGNCRKVCSLFNIYMKEYAK